MCCSLQNGAFVVARRKGHVLACRCVLGALRASLIGLEALDYGARTLLGY